VWEALRGGEPVVEVSRVVQIEVEPARQWGRALVYAVESQSATQASGSLAGTPSELDRTSETVTAQ